MIKRESKDYIFGLDVFRGFAIILMFITHACRLYLESGSKLASGDMGDNFLSFFMAIEPFTSSSFLFLVGIGLAFSASKVKEFNPWVLRISKKALGLYLIGIIFFLFENGFQLLDVFLSPSILSTIALALIITSLTIRSNLALSIALGLVLLTSSLVENQLTISGVNGGPGGAFPLIGFSLFGALITNLYLRKSLSLMKVLVLGSVLGIGGFLLSSEQLNLQQILSKNWTSLYPSIYSKFPAHGEGIIGQVKALGSDVEPTKYITSFWNHNVLGFVRLLLPLTLCFFISIFFSKLLESKKINHALSLLGRHALGCYILHLGLIGISSLVGFIPQSSTMAWAYVAGLIVICLGYSYKKEN